MARARISSACLWRGDNKDPLVKADILTVCGGGFRGKSTINFLSSMTLVIWHLILMNPVVKMKLLLTYLHHAHQPLGGRNEESKWEQLYGIQ